MKIIYLASKGGFTLTHFAIRMLIAEGQYGIAALDVEKGVRIPDHAYEEGDYHYDSSGIFYQGDYYTDNQEKCRHNPALISMIETYGSEKINKFGKLAIAEYDLEQHIEYVTHSGELIR